MVKLNPRQFKSLQSVNQNLIRKYEGPLEITVKAGKISYRVDMPHHLKIHPVFHAGQLKPYFEDREDKERGQSGRARIFITPPTVDKQIEAIIDHQLVRGKGWNNSSSYFTGKGQHRRGRLGKNTRTCGSFATKSTNTCSCVASGSSPVQMGERVPPRKAVH